MTTKINDVDINYTIFGNPEGINIVLLHGWGQNIEMMIPIGEYLKKDYRIVIIDLPGHGKSSIPTYPWTVNDYALAIKELLEKEKIKNPVLIGHSFGGKISLLYASKYDVQKLIVFGSPFKKEVKKLSLKVKILKFLKKVPIINKLEGFAKRHIGSEDYRKASDMMRKILVNTVNLDITEDVKKIKCPTLIIWGSLDTEVSLERAYELEKLINDAAVIVYEGCTHYAYLERLNQTIKIIRNFLSN
ncbi:MAG: alpha/beta hydrolase [Mollicutes bacterium]|nr:alpha/beta hydrolase [Mollicutes bacterium]